MIAVSDEYKTAVTKSNRRWTAKAQIDFSDYNIDNSITSTINHPDRSSVGDQMADGVETPAYKFWTWSHFEWGQHLRDPNAEDEQGGLSQYLSNSSNDFDNWAPDGFGSPLSGFGNLGFAGFNKYPSFRLNFAARTVVSLKVVFDDKLLEWAEEFDVNVYTDDYDTPEHTENITGNTSYKWETTIAAIFLVTGIEVVVKKWNKPDSKAKIMELFTSLQIKYSADMIKGISLIEETESDASDSPIENVVSNSIILKLFNLNNKFDNDNLSSVLYGNVTKNRRIKAWTWLNDLIDDLIPWGTFYADQWKIDNENMSAEVSGKDLLFLMDEAEYTEDQFITPGIDQNFTYTTNADFSTFTLDNIIVENDSLVFQGSAIECDESYSSLYGFGQYGFGFIGFSGPTFCGSAIKAINYNYTPGVSVTLSLSYNGTVLTNSQILWYINWKEEEEWYLFDGEFTFTPENISDTTQTVYIKAFMITNNVVNPLTIEDISITLSEKITLYSLAAKIIQDYDDQTNLIEGNYIIDQSYGDYEIPHAFFAPQSYRSCLKKIVGAAGGRAYVRRDGFLILQTLQIIGDTVKEYDYDNIKKLTQPVKPFTLYNRVTTYIYEYILADAAEEVAKINISIEDTEVQEMIIQFEKFPVESGTFSYNGLPVGVTVTDSIEYTWGVWLELTNASGGDEEFELSIEAEVYELIGNRYYQEDDTDSIRRNGIIELPIRNYLIQSMSQAVAITGTIIDSFKTQRRNFEADVIFDPSLLLGDTVTINGTKYLVNKSRLAYNINEIKHVLEGKR